MAENDFGERLREAFQKAKDADIARQIGVSQPAVKNYMDGRVPPAETLIKISDLTNCSIHWLLTGQGEMKVRKQGPVPDSVLSLVDRHVTWTDEPPGRTVIFNSTTEAVIDELARTQGKTFDRVIYDLVIESLEAKGLVNTQPFESIKLIPVDIEWVTIKLLGYISCGDPIEAIPNTDEIRVAKTFPYDPRQMFALIARGESMIDMDIRDGDRILCRAESNPKNGDVVIALINGEATCKRFYLRGGEIHLVPANPDYKTRVFAPDQVVIQGIVEEIQRRTKS